MQTTMRNFVVFFMMMTATASAATALPTTVRLDLTYTASHAAKNILGSAFRVAELRFVYLNPPAGYQMVFEGDITSARFTQMWAGDYEVSLRTSPPAVETGASQVTVKKSPASASAPLFASAAASQAKTAKLPTPFRPPVLANNSVAARVKIVPSPSSSSSSLPPAKPATQTPATRSQVPVQFDRLDRQKITRQRAQESELLKYVRQPNYSMFASSVSASPPSPLALSASSASSPNQNSRIVMDNEKKRQEQIIFWLFAFCLSGSFLLAIFIVGVLVFNWDEKIIKITNVINHRYFRW